MSVELLDIFILMIYLWKSTDMSQKKKKLTKLKKNPNN